MSALAEKLLEQIDTSAPGSTVTAVEQQHRFRLGLTDAGPLAVSFSELRLTTEELEGAGVERVRRVAEWLTERVTYLLEPLTPVEIDQELAVVQMRSVDPAQDEQGASYYELLVKTGGSVSLRRYRKPRGAMWEPIDATVTREVLGRLAGDFMESVGS